jgi:AraC-like DNA-binding protein
MAIFVSKRMTATLAWHLTCGIERWCDMYVSDWAQYWRADGLPVEAMHAHFTSHVYHRHSHETYSFGVTESGAQAFTCRNDSHVSGPGMLMTFNPDDPHDGHAASDGGFTYRMVHVWPEFFAGLLGEGSGAEISARPLPLFRDPLIDDPAAAAALRRLFGAIRGPGTSLERHERMIDAAGLLARHATGRPPVLRSSPGTRIAAQLKSAIHDLPMSDLTADDLAAAAGCSRYAAYRAFRSVYGLAPSDYQRQLRIRQARRLLADGTSPAEAAAAAGFADQAHLTRWFRRYYGVTPGAYRTAK